MFDRIYFPANFFLRHGSPFRLAMPQGARGITHMQRHEAETDKFTEADVQCYIQTKCRVIFKLPKLNANTSIHSDKQYKRPFSQRPRFGN